MLSRNDEKKTCTPTMMSVAPRTARLSSDRLPNPRSAQIAKTTAQTVVHDRSPGGGSGDGVGERAPVAERLVVYRRQPTAGPARRVEGVERAATGEPERVRQFHRHLLPEQRELHTPC